MTVYAIKEEGFTKSNVIELVGSSACLIGLFVAGSVGWVCGAMSLGVAFYSFCSEPAAPVANNIYP